MIFLQLFLAKLVLSNLDMDIETHMSASIICIVMD